MGVLHSTWPCGPRIPLGGGNHVRSGQRGRSRAGRPGGEQVVHDMGLLLGGHGSPVDRHHLVDDLGPLLPAERRLAEGEAGRVADQARGLELVPVRAFRQFDIPGRVRRHSPKSPRPRRRDGGRPSPRRPSSRSRRSRRRSSPDRPPGPARIAGGGWRRRRGRAWRAVRFGSGDMDGHLLDDVSHEAAPVPAFLVGLDLPVTGRGPGPEAMLAP